MSHDEIEYAEFDVEDVEAATSKALLCRVEGILYWIPKSQIRSDSEVQFKGDHGALFIPEWLAIEKGMV